MALLSTSHSLTNTNNANSSAQTLPTPPAASFRVFVHPPAEELLPSVCAIDTADPAREIGLLPSASSSSYDYESEDDEGSEEDDLEAEFETDLYYSSSEDLRYRRGGSARGRRRTFEGRRNADGQGDVLGAAEQAYEFSSDEEDDELDREEEREREARAGDASMLESSANDSEVIEVVKVKRRRGEADEDEGGQETPRATPAPTPLPRSNTFMAKASRVFSSLRLKSKPAAPPPEAAPSPPVIAPVAKTETTSKAKSLRNDRRSSLSLGQIFARASSPTPDARSASPTPAPTKRASSDMLAEAHSAPTVTRSPSPTPSTTRSGFIRRRVSVLIPTFTASPSAPEPLAQRRNFSEPSSRTSSSGSSESDVLTPVDLPPSTTSTNTNVKVRRSFSFARRSSETATAAPEVVAPEPVKIVAPVEGAIAEDGEMSMEMRLDSLHFDDMSFDMTKF